MFVCLNFPVATFPPAPDRPPPPTSAPHLAPLPSFWTRTAAAGGGGGGRERVRRGEEGEEVKKSEVAEEGKKESAAGVKGADGQRFLPTLDSSPACVRMAALPGTVPRMMRPAPGQNYPRTGFPLEGKSASAPPPGARGPRRRSHLQGWRRRHWQWGGRRGGALPVSSGTESGRWTPEVSGADTCPFLRGFRWPAARPHRSRGPWPSSAGRNPGQISAPRKCQLFVNFSSFHYFQILPSPPNPYSFSQLSCVRPCKRVLLLVPNCSFLFVCFPHCWDGLPKPLLFRNADSMWIVCVSKPGRFSASSKATVRNSCSWGLETN